MRIDRAIFWELERAATSPWPVTPQETPPPIAEGSPLMEKDSLQEPVSQPVRRIGPNVTRVLIALIVGMTVTVSSGMWALAIHADAIPAMMDAMTPVAVWAQEMGSKAFLLAVGAGGGGVGGVALGRKKPTSAA